MKNIADTVMPQTAFTLVNLQTQAPAFKIFVFEDDSYFIDLKNQNCYTIVLVTEGKGMVDADFTTYPFEANSLICFSVHQPYKIKTEGNFKGILFNFHPDFFCIHKHQPEVACNGVLFNNIYESPVVPLSSAEVPDFLQLANQLIAEMQHKAVAQYELLISYLKIFLINASRIKLNQAPKQALPTEKEPFILQTLKDLIELHYKTKRGAGEYADMLNISTKALNRISKTHFNKTLTNLITERIIIEAKRELYLTAKPVKTIAYELGFQDEFYFSRYFKSNAEVSPQLYRNTVGFARAEG